jgi:hypothetical protein
MNTRTALVPVVNGDAAIQCLDAIAKTVEAPFR